MATATARAILIMTNFKVICAWCGKFLRGDPWGELVSHGICDACVRQVSAEIAGEVADPTVWGLWQDIGGEG